MIVGLLLLGWGLALVFFAAAWQMLNWLGEAEDELEAYTDTYARRSPRGARGR